MQSRLQPGYGRFQSPLTPARSWDAIMVRQQTKGHSPRLMFHGAAKSNESGEAELDMERTQGVFSRLSESLPQEPDVGRQGVQMTGCDVCHIPARFLHQVHDPRLSNPVT